MSTTSTTSTTSASQKTIQQIIDKGTSSTSERNTGELGKTDFLNLLVTQMKYQDPLEPTGNTEYISQMASFSALEQMQNLNNSFTETKAFSFVGKYITANISDDKTNTTSVINGTVSSIKISDGKYYAIVSGKEVNLDDITNVADSSTASGTNLSSYTGLLGYKANGIAYDSETGDMIKVTGVVKAIQKGTYEDYAVMDGVDVEISGIVSSTKSTDTDYVKNTLEDAYKNGKSISVEIVDRSTGKKVPVTATIASLNVTSSKITATLNGVNIPIEGITNITKPETSTK